MCIMKSYNRLRYLPQAILITWVAFILFSCANMSRPGGGPKDETPPHYIKSKPLPNACNISDRRIEIEFDELIQVEKPSEKVIISPPQINMPKIQAQGKKVRIDLQDSLLANTTYTIDFSDAIVDNNEKNPLSGFSISFSTGATRDSLQVSGVLLNAENLEPITGMLVGAYSNLDDTAFTTIPMERIASSDALGHFTIRGLKANCPYRIFALKDANRNYYFDSPTEDIAYYDSIVTAYSEPRQYADTLYTDSLTVDTIVYIDYNSFFPNDILLLAFNEQKKNRYMEDKSRKQRNKLDFIFSTPHDSLPTITPLNFEPDSNWYVLETNTTNDTLSYWLRDSLIYNIDTLQVAMQYYRTDTLNNLSLYNDTLSMTYRAPKANKNNKKKRSRAENDTTPEVPPMVFADMKINAGSSQDVHKPIAIEFTVPIDSINYNAFHLYEKNDTLWNTLPDSVYTIAPDSAVARTYLVSYKWKPEGEYKLLVDSMAVIDMYGLHTDKSEQSFKIKSMQEYSNLYFAITGVADSAVVQLLDSSDKPTAEAPVVNGGAEFTYLKPGTYYARLFIDRNGNGKYDTGNYALQQQPEEVYYYPQGLELRAYWNVEQDWNIFQTAIDAQKPLPIKKNKPKEEKKNNNDENNQNNNNYGGNNYGGNNYGGNNYGGNSYGNAPGMPSGNNRY